MAENDFLGHSRGTCNSTIRAKQVIKEKWQRFSKSLVHTASPVFASQDRENPGVKEDEACCILAGM